MLIVNPQRISVFNSFTSVVKKPQSAAECGTELHGVYAYIYASISTHEKISIRYYFYLFFFICATNTEATTTRKKLDGYHG